MAVEDQNEGGEETVLWARERVSLKAHSNNVTCASFLRNQDVACTGSQDGTVMMWSVKQGWTHRLRAHTGWVTCLAVQLQGALMASGSADETVRLWHLAAVLEAAGDSQVPCPQSASPAATEMSVVLKNYGGCVKCCAFNNSGSLLACGSADNLVRVWSVGDTRLLYSLKGHKNWVLALSFHPSEAAKFATASADGSLGLWDLKSPGGNLDAPTILKAPRAKLASAAAAVSVGSSKDLVSCAYNPDGSLLACGGADKMIRIWDVPRQVCQRVLAGHRGQVNALAFQGRSGRLLASVEGNASFHRFSSDNALILWDLDAAHGEELKVRRTGHKRRVNCCAFNAAGSLLVTGANDNTVKLWLLSPELASWGPGQQVSSGSGNEALLHAHGSDALLGHEESSSLHAAGVCESWHSDSVSGEAYRLADSASEAGSTTTSLTYKSASTTARAKGGGCGESAEEFDVEEEHGGGETSRTGTLGHSPRLDDEASANEIDGDSECRGRQRMEEQWVQLRAEPYVVEARMLELSSGVTHHGSFHSHAILDEVVMDSEQVDQDGVPVFSVAADFGRMALGSSLAGQGLNPPSEPPSTGMEMRKHFSGSLAR